MWLTSMRNIPQNRHQIIYIEKDIDNAKKERSKTTAVNGHLDADIFFPFVFYKYF